MSIAMVDVPLFEGLDVPVVMDDPRGAATRVGDPIQSHLAADRSQATAPVVRERVLHILAYRGRRMTGNEINTEYAARSGRHRRYLRSDVEALISQERAS